MLKKILRAFSSEAQAIKKDNICAEDTHVKGGGERQASKGLKGISLDHRKRYELAATYISPGVSILDIACGVGYGSYILAKQTDCQSITAIDISSDAIDYARNYYSSDVVTYKQGDCVSCPLEKEAYDIVVSFETIEHIQEDQRFLERVFTALKPGGKLILSTPNEALMPYKPESFPFHVKHYTPEQLQQMITSFGFSIDDVFSQLDKRAPDPIRGWEGKYNIVICSKEEH